MDRMGRWGKVGALCWLLAATGCSNDDGNRREADEAAHSLHGRAFGSEDGKSLTNASVRVDDAMVESDGKGSFALSYTASNKSKSVEVTAKDHAPVTKATPKGDGYLEVFAKPIDEKQTFAADKDSVLKSRKGASLSIKAGSLPRSALQSQRSMPTVCLFMSPRSMASAGSLSARSSAS